MNRLGKTLEAYYDDVRKEGVPDRFKDLLQQLEGRQDKERPDDPGSLRTRGDACRCS